MRSLARSIPCNTVEGTLLAGTSCPKGDIPWYPNVCVGPFYDVITMYNAIPLSEQELTYEFRTVPLSLCDDLPQFWGPSTNGFSEPAPGCLGPFALCSFAIGGLFQDRWCY